MISYLLIAASLNVDQLVDEVRLQKVTKHYTPKVRIVLKYEPQAYPEKVPKFIV